VAVTKSLKKPKLKNICQRILKNKELEDIFIIGSFVKGKEKARDIDLCFIFNNYNDKIIKDAYDDFNKNNLNVHITKTKFNNMLEDASLWKTILHEGYSIKKKKNVSEVLNITPYFLFEYSLKVLNKIKKQIFSHALYGTGGRESFLKLNNGFKTGKGSIIVPIKNSERIREFFDTWNVVYKARRIWL